MKGKGIRRGLRGLLAALALMLLFAIPVSAKSKPTTYNGTNYAKVYDYTYYMNWMKTNHPNTYKKLKSKSGAYVLKYFVTKGMAKKHRGNAAFDVQSYYNQNWKLRYNYGKSWSKYYLYYIKNGKSSVTPASSITNYITQYYDYQSWVPLSSIYDFKYFTTHYSPAYKYWKNQDDAGAIKYFVDTAMIKRVQGKEGVTGNSTAYNKIYKKFYSTTSSKLALEADKKARDLSSKTKYLILVNRANYRVYIYKGSKGNWTRIKAWKCGVGSKATPTPRGTFKLGYKGLHFNHGNIRCWYYSAIQGSILFHSKLYHSASKPLQVFAGNQYGWVSGGCVRLDINNAYYIYNKIPKKTTVVVY